MEVTLTMAPCAFANSSINPRASQMVAKKFTSKTWRQTSISVVEHAQPLAALALGRNARIVDERMQLAVREALRAFRPTARIVSSGSARSTWM